jgi:DNA-binding transcriptional regulator WhiA
MGKKKEIDEKEIIRLYTEENFSASKIGRLFNVDVATITNRLKVNNIEVKKTHRKYLINKDYFEVIDSEDKAYWLGFLMADGYNSGYLIRVDIQDEGHLEKLRDRIYINCDMPIRKKKNITNGKDIFYLTIQDKKLLSDVECLGLVKRKSMIVSYPNIDSEYDRFFIKGVFDGDGCLTYSMDKNYRRYTFSIVGSYDLMKTLQLILSKNNVNIKFRKMKSIYSVYLRGNRQIIKILDWLYNGTTTHLDRKYEKYQDMLNYYKNK